MNRRQTVLAARRRNERSARSFLPKSCRPLERPPKIARTGDLPCLSSQGAFRAIEKELNLIYLHDKFLFTSRTYSKYRIPTPSELQALRAGPAIARVIRLRRAVFMVRNKAGTDLSPDPAQSDIPAVVPTDRGVLKILRSGILSAETVAFVGKNRNIICGWKDCETLWPGTLQISAVNA